MSEPYAEQPWLEATNAAIERLKMRVGNGIIADATHDHYVVYCEIEPSIAAVMIAQCQSNEFDHQRLQRLATAAFNAR